MSKTGKSRTTRRPPSRTPQGARGPARPGFRSWPLIAVAAVTAVLAGGFVVYLLGGSGSEEFPPGTTLTPAQIAAHVSEEERGVKPPKKPGARHVKAGDNGCGNRSNPAQELMLTTAASAYEPTRLKMSECAPTQLNLANKDVDPHNVSIWDSEEFRRHYFTSTNVEAGDAVTYDFMAPPAGSYYFICDLHPFMEGKIRVR